MADSLNKNRSSFRKDLLYKIYQRNHWINKVDNWINKVIKNISSVWSLLYVLIFLHYFRFTQKKERTWDLPTAKKKRKGTSITFLDLSEPDV